jgi:hypothetical protein
MSARCKSLHADNCVSKPALVGQGQYWPPWKTSKQAVNRQRLHLQTGRTGPAPA